MPVVLVRGTAEDVRKRVVTRWVGYIVPATITIRVLDQQRACIHFVLQECFVCLCMDVCWHMPRLGTKGFVFQV